MPKQRRQTITEHADYLKKVVDVRPSTQLIQSQISSAEGVVKRRDIYNFRAKQQNLGGGEFELDLILKEMQRVQGTTVKIFHENDELQAIYFQDARMKSYYANYPDLIMFDGTYSLNDRLMVLIILLVIDGNAESQIAGLFLARSENVEDFNNLFAAFKEENPNHGLTEVIVTDKHATNLNVVKNQFPNAVHHLCVFHVTQAFQRNVTSKAFGITSKQRNHCLGILSKMVYADSQNEFDQLYAELVATNHERKLLFTVPYSSPYLS